MLEQCEPKPVWRYFERFCAIPHPSGYEKEAARFIVELAEDIGLTYVTDKVGNVLVRKSAHPASSGRSPVILQSHLDMVPQKNADTLHDFMKDPIRPAIDGEWVKACGTTLGADNGIGVAIACAVLESSSLRHGPVEALFTVDEERGMTGAFGLADGWLTGRKLINLDTENENEICIGCAGGTDLIATLPVSRENPGSGQSAFTIAVQGLRGGHSGMEIHLGRSNALKLLARILSGFKGSFDIHLASLHGGSARNAIPREAFAGITLPASQASDFLTAAAAREQEVAHELVGADSGFRIVVNETALPGSVLDADSHARIMRALADCPYGVIRMNETVPGMVETSNNLAIVTTDNDSFRIDCMLRSSSDEQLDHFSRTISSDLARQGAAIDFGGRYPGWQPMPESALLATMKKAYETVHGKLPNIVTVHAGLECGIIGSRFSGIEMISCGPTIRFAHSPDERMNIASVERFWRCLVEALEHV